MTRSARVSLVTSSPNNAESLALGSLAAALKNARHKSTVYTFGGAFDIDDVAKQVILDDSILLGVSIQSGYAAIDNLAFIHRVRQLGYRGHITVGGTYATLASRRLFDQCEHIGSVIRHDGEIPIVALCNALIANEPIDRLPAVTTRTSVGLFAPVAEQEHLSLRPLRPRSRLYAGVLASEISATRGCFGTCSYCGLKALREKALGEGLACGFDRQTLKERGVGAIRRRSVEDVADEIASLYHDQGVRFFHFVDENHLPPQKGEAAKSLHALCDALDARGVRERAFNLMMRADALDEDVADALDRLGLVRCLLGVESTTSKGLKALSRGCKVEHNKSAMVHLSRLDVCFHFNVLLVHPDSCMDEIDQEIEGLKNVFGGLVDPFQLEAFEGTEVFERLQKEQRLHGGPLIWQYWPMEAEARRFAKLFYRLKLEALGKLQLTAFAYEVLGTLAVADRLNLLQNNGSRCREKAQILIQRHNRLWNSWLQEMSRFARHGLDNNNDVLPFLKRVEQEAAELIMVFKGLETDLQTAAVRPLTCQIRYRNATAAVALATLLLGTGACNSSTSIDEQEEGSDTLAEETESTEVTDLDTETASEDETTVSDTETEPCDQVAASQEGRKAIRLASEEGCSSLCDLVGWDTGEGYRFTLDSEGYVIGLENHEGKSLQGEIVDCYVKALEGQKFPTLKECGNTWTEYCVLLA